MKNALLDKLRSGEKVFGIFCALDSPEIVEVLGLAGLDFVILDMEHGPLTPPDVQNLARAAELRGITALARTTTGSRTDVLRVLDAGVQGVVVPQVSDRREAGLVAEGARYHPLGQRGVALPRSAAYGSRDLFGYFEEANRETLVAVQIESQAALDDLDAILGTEGVDMAFVGPFDLSQSLGIPGQVTHPRIEKALEDILAACRRNGKHAGIFATDAGQALRRAEEGFSLVAVGIDATLFFGAAKKLAEALEPGRKAPGSQK